MLKSEILFDVITKENTFIILFSNKKDNRKENTSAFIADFMVEMTHSNRVTLLGHNLRL